jgi:hypothetical protein
MVATTGQAAAYIDKIMRGAKPADLRTAARSIRGPYQPQDREVLSLEIPPMLLAIADEVIE